ncbi:MAG: di-trans,poly-cis-decaprenylcistransferase [Candidatus Margulisbacteria bacterium GWF2_35_9]|nr:MAG: di-trans,poly-cis-decaprenylcistransferase [Candidatus Margulisbacteria bacterium GWF2_35_9]
MTKLKIPSHIAIIMDGNGRWAKKRMLPRTIGHNAGVKALKRTIKIAYEIGVKHLSVYVFSTENWKRPKPEVDFLMSILNNIIEKEVKELNDYGVKVKFCGEISELSPSLQDKINWAEEFTKKNNKLHLNLLVNYGSRKEIVSAVQQLIKEGCQNITEEEISSHLYTKESPDPELIIRTGGDNRLSNFMLWQGAYSEIWVTKQYWPDFNRKILMKAIEDFSGRDRRFGGLNE